MTAGEARTLLSVQGQARRTVDPDQATMMSTVEITSETKSASTTAVAAIVAEVTGALAGLGGQALSAHTPRAELTWSVQSIRTYAEHDHDKMTGQHGPTGRHVSSATLVIEVRDFALLDPVEAILAHRDPVNVQSVQWSVDDDNLQWADVRAQAISAALQKGQDYAAALGGEVVSIDQIADAGLLAADATGPWAAKSASYRATAGGHYDSASLDPVPQVLTAVIDARLTATVGPLPTH